MKKICKIATGLLAACTLGGCSNYKTITGSVGEALETEFYNFTVNSVKSSQAIGDYIPNDGDQFVIVNVSVENTYKDTITMTDHHFQLQYTVDDDDDIPNTTAEAVGNTSAEVAYYLPLSDSTDTVFMDDELASSYELTSGESITGTLIFEVPSDKTVFDFCSADYFSYGSSDEVMTGNTYFVSVTPEA